MGWVPPWMGARPGQELALVSSPGLHPSLRALGLEGLPSGAEAQQRSCPTDSGSFLPSDGHRGGGDTKAESSSPQGET